MLGDAARRSSLVLALALSGLASEAEAQYLGHNLTGDFGLFAGSQAPPGRYVGIYVPYYRSDTLKLERSRSLDGEPGNEVQV